jgi:hypothetical protein
MEKMNFEKKKNWLAQLASYHWGVLFLSFFEGADLGWGVLKLN